MCRELGGARLGGAVQQRDRGTKAAVARADTGLTVAVVPETQVAVHRTTKVGRKAAPVSFLHLAAPELTVRLAAHERWLVVMGQRAGPGRPW